MNRRQAVWNGFRVGVSIFPLLPLVGGVLVVGGSIWVWWQDARQICQRSRLWLLALYLTLLLLSSWQALDPSAARLGLFHFFPFAFVFAAASQLMRRPRHLQQLAEAIALSSLPVAVIGLGQMFAGWQGPLDWGLVLSWPLAAGGMPPGRMSSVFEYANVLANFAAIAWTVGLGLWAKAWRQGRWRWGLLWSAVLVGNALVLLLTSSRNAWGVAFLACVAYAVFWGWRWVLGAIGAIAAAILGAAFAPNPLNLALRRVVPAYFWARLTDDMHPDRPVAMLRTTQWQFALDLTGDRPLWGWGLRNFTAIYETQMGLWLGHPHNLVVMLLAETGIPATLTLLGFVAWIVTAGIRQLSRWSEADSGWLFAILAAFGATTVFHSLDVTLFDARLNILGWLLLAGVDGVSRRSVPPVQPKVPQFSQKPGEARDGN